MIHGICTVILQKVRKWTGICKKCIGYKLALVLLGGFIFSLLLYILESFHSKKFLEGIEMRMSMAYK